MCDFLYLKRKKQINEVESKLGLWCMCYRLYEDTLCLLILVLEGNFYLYQYICQLGWDQTPIICTP